MTNSWSEKIIGDLIDVKHGFAFKGEFFKEDPTPEVLLTPGNFRIGGGFKFDKLKYYDGPIPEEYILNEGDLLVTMTDLSKQADTLGYPAFVPAREGHRYHHNQRLGLVKVLKPKELDKRFLYYIFCSREYRDEIIASATGSTVKHTSPSKIRAFVARLPDLKTQEQIAHILGTLDDKIELNRRMSQTLEMTAQAIFKSWFVDFEPVQAKAAAKATGADSATIERAAMAVIAGRSIEEAIAENDYFDDVTLSTRKTLAQTAALFPDSFQGSDLGDIPEGWVLRSLDKVATYQNGLALQKFRPKENENPLPIVKIANLKTGEPNWEELASPSIKPDCILNNGDVVFSWSGTLMVTLWCGGRSALNQHLFKVTSKEFPKWFYLYWTKTHLADFQRVAADKAVTMGHIKRSHLTAAMCTIPAASDLLDEASKFLNPLIEQIINFELQSRTLAQLRDTLLPRLLSGELPVPDAASQTDEMLS